MGTATFRRHTRARVDAALGRLFASLRRDPHRHTFLTRLLDAVRPGSDLLWNPPTSSGDVPGVQALASLVAFAEAAVRAPEEWSGATGHPLRVVDSLASHLFGRYPTPRFLASAWLGTATARRRREQGWFVAHARGKRIRSLDVPVAMTRRMEHVFLGSPDHLPIGPALRRAEVIGLGGSPELAAAILATRIADGFDEPARWRAAITWMVRCGEALDPSQVGPIVDFLAANLHGVDLRGRTVASVMRLVREWHRRLGATRAPFRSWPRSRWRELREGAWTLVELLDSHALLLEGRAMRHCVATYATACATRASSIWSLRHRGPEDEVARSVLTIEVYPRTGRIVQVRGKANSRPTGLPLELVYRWASREGLRMA